MNTRLNLVTANEAATRLGVHHKTIARLLREEILAGMKVSNRWLVEQSTLDEFSKHYIGRKGRPKGYTPIRRSTDESSTLRPS